LVNLGRFKQIKTMKMEGDWGSEMMTTYHITLKNGKTLDCDYLRQIDNDFLVRQIHETVFNLLTNYSILNIEFKHS
jgi:hypothetical protein